MYHLEISKIWINKQDAIEIEMVIFRFYDKVLIRPNGHNKTIRVYIYIYMTLSMNKKA